MGKITLVPGAPAVTLTVTSAQTVEGKFGPQVKLDSDEGTLYLSETTAQRQLGRIGLTLQSVVGATIAVEQVVKDGKTYTNINHATAPTANAASGSVGGYSPTGVDFLDQQATDEAQAVRAIQQGAPTTTVAIGMGKLAALYAQCLIVASDNVPKALEAHGVKPTAEAIVAATATLFIAAKERGLAA